MIAVDDKATTPCIGAQQVIRLTTGSRIDVDLRSQSAQLDRRPAWYWATHLRKDDSWQFSSLHDQMAVKKTALRAWLCAMAQVKSWRGGKE